MSTDETYLTKEGESELRKELKHLSEVVRPELVIQLSVGREEGKLRENANYDDAREGLCIVDHQIRRINEVLGSAQVVDSEGRDEEFQLREELLRIEVFKLPELSRELQKAPERLVDAYGRPLKNKAYAKLQEDIQKIEDHRNDLRNRLRSASTEKEKNELEEQDREQRDKKHELTRKLNKTPEYQVDAQNRPKKNPEYTKLEIVRQNVEARRNHIQLRLNNIITKEDEDILRKELHDLVRQRPALAQKLKEAVAQGDLKENADYHDTREKMGIVEGRVREIEEILRIAVIVELAGLSDEVRIGSVVVIREDGTGEEEEYRIVGSAEANPRERKISQKSPIGSALLGKTRGRKVNVKTPDGLVKFKILDIR